MPHSSGACLGEMLGPGCWRRSRDLVVIGAGGTASSLLIALFGPGSRDEPFERPGRVVLIDVDPARISAGRALIRELGVDVHLESVLDGERAAAAALAAAGPGSMIVHATGLGKDRPGSPIALPAAWPREAVVWEANYRGPRPLFEDARRQAPALRLRVHDGWRLFIHGWAQFVGRLVGRPLTAAELERFEAAAERPRLRRPERRSRG